MLVILLSSDAKFSIIFIDLGSTLNYYSRYRNEGYGVRYYTIYAKMGKLVGGGGGGMGGGGGGV